MGRENKQLTIRLFLIGLAATVALASWQIYLAHTTPEDVAERVSKKVTTFQIPDNSSISTTIINQELVECDLLPNGQSGLSYYNKTLGFSITLPNVNWEITEDNGYFVSRIGMIENEHFLGGIMIDQRYTPNLLISVFHDENQTSIEKFLGKNARQITQKIEWSHTTINTGSDDNAGILEIEGSKDGTKFYVFQKAIRTNDKIYLIHYPNFEIEHPENIFDEIDEMYLSANIFPPCKNR